MVLSCFDLVRRIDFWPGFVSQLQSVSVDFSATFRTTIGLNGSKEDDLLLMVVRGSGTL